GRGFLGFLGVEGGMAAMGANSAEGRGNSLFLASLRACLLLCLPDEILSGLQMIGSAFCDLNPVLARKRLLPQLLQGETAPDALPFQPAAAVANHSSFIALMASPDPCDAFVSGLDKVGGEIRC